MSGASKSIWVSVAAVATAAVLPLTAFNASAGVGRDSAAVSRPSASAHPMRSSPPRCSAEQLRVRIRAAGSQMSQPYARIAVRNVGQRACTVGGYPRLTAVRGARIGRHNIHRLAIHLRRGSFTEARDRGAHPIGLRPGGSAVFGLGTATAYGRRVVTIRSLTVRLHLVDGAFDLPLRIDASSRPGKRIPVFVTALARRVEPRLHH